MRAWKSCFVCGTIVLIKYKSKNCANETVCIYQIVYLHATGKNPEVLLKKCEKQMKHFTIFRKSIEDGSSNKLIPGQSPFVEEVRVKVLPLGVKPILSFMMAL